MRWCGFLPLRPYTVLSFPVLPFSLEGEEKMSNDKKGQGPYWPSQDLFHLHVNEFQELFIQVVAQQLPIPLPLPGTSCWEGPVPQLVAAKSVGSQGGDPISEPQGKCHPCLYLPREGFERRLRQ